MWRWLRRHYGLCVFCVECGKPVLRGGVSIFFIGGWFKSFRLVIFVFNSKPQVVHFLGPAFIFVGGAVFCQSCLASSRICRVVVLVDVVGEAVKTLKVMWALSFSCGVH